MLSRPPAPAAPGLEENLAHDDLLTADALKVCPRREKRAMSVTKPRQRRDKSATKAGNWRENSSSEWEYDRNYNNMSNI
jgi:hypothetical protein